MRASWLLPCAVLVGSCVHDGYPLSTSGAVDVRLDVAGALFAADTRDPNGARQTPSETGVTLTLSEDDEPAFGAYVDVRVSPPEALALVSDPSEKKPSCVASRGGLRCSADEEGHARLLLRSEGTWSGAAKLEVLWGGNAPKEQAITILPAGLPAEATDFRMIVDGLDQATRVQAELGALQCTTSAAPTTSGEVWREGAIRARTARILASPPAGRPAAVANAPVQITSLGAEGAMSSSKDCKERTTRLRVLLDEQGRSPEFYLCFSDRGGSLRFNVSSGEKRIDPAPTISVDTEPHLLRVRALQGEVTVGAAPVGLFEITAYDADLRRIALPIDVTSDDPKVLGLGVLSVTLAADGSPATVVEATPLKAGSARIHAYPMLHAQPDCASASVTVVP